MKLLFLFFALVITGGKCARILLVAPMPSYSHFTVAFRLGKELADRGHQVTAITPYPQKTRLKNYRDIPVVENIQIYVGPAGKGGAPNPAAHPEFSISSPLAEYFLKIQLTVVEEKKKLFGKKQKGLIENLSSLFTMSSLLTEYTLANPDVRTLINSDENFDVVIIENFLNEAAVGLGYRFKAPVILLSSVTSSVMNNYIFANPAPPSYIPSKGGILTKHMNFWERIQNLLMISVFNLIMEFYHLPIQREIFKRYISSDVELDFVLYNNVSLMLTNSHVSVSDAIPLVPSIKEIGGYHVTTSQKLPDDLQSFLDDSPEGVVLFSLGATLQSSELPPRIVDSILKAFSKIKQKVLWKFETDLETPNNVKIMKWLPQQDILAHPNVRAFITHGGFLSVVETVYHGVPVIGLPVFGDQKYNIAAAVSNGYAISIPLNQLTEEKLSRALDEILNNPKYLENAQKRSKLMHDQPLKPIDSAVYWVEYVIRHRGASHLKSAGLQLYWIQREMIDIFLFLLFVIILLLIVVYVAIKKIRSLLCHKTEKIVTTKKKIKKN